MPRWLLKVLKRIHQRAAARDVRLTLKAGQESQVLGLSPEDVRDVLAGLGTRDAAGRVISGSTGEWMYVFRPEVGEQRVYVKLVLREDCVVVSFHDDEGGGHEEDRQ